MHCLPGLALFARIVTARLRALSLARGLTRLAELDEQDETDRLRARVMAKEFSIQAGPFLTEWEAIDP